MTAALGTVRLHQDGQTATFQVEGWGRMTNSLPLRRCAEQALDAGTTVVRVDLRRCTHMDSTFLGTLLNLRRSIERRDRGQLVLVSPSPECCKILRQMGLDRIFPSVTEEEPAGGAWVELTGGMADVEAFQRNVVEAHQGLAGLDGPAGETFREVARCVTEEMQARKTQ